MTELTNAATRVLAERIRAGSLDATGNEARAKAFEA